MAIERLQYTKLLQLKDELVMFLTEQKSAFAELFLNDAWVLSYVICLTFSEN